MGHRGDAARHPADPRAWRLARDRSGRDLGPAPLALAAAAIAYAGSLWWCRVFRRELLGSLA
ncbi:hypothetical protein MOP88_03295 [Sphingomonas sp. WKB10]|nr:hypothetical protein [Sphingomonas sp. WKB10]